MNEFQKSMLAKYKYTSYTRHFDGTYRFLGGLSIVLLALSCLAVAKFAEGFLAPIFGSAALFAGMVLAAFVGYFTHTQTEKLMVYYHSQRVIEPVLGLKLAILVAVTIAADYFGAPKWAYNIVGEAPADAKTSELGNIYAPQIEAINSEIADIEAKHFYWCGTHSTAHKCASAQFYIDPKADKKHVAKIEELKAQRTELQSTMNGLLSDAGKQYNAQLGEYNDTLEASKSNMRFGSLLFTFLFFLATKWRHDFGTRFVNEIDTAGTATAEGYTAKPKAKAVYGLKAHRVRRVKASKQPFSPAELAQASRELEEKLAHDNIEEQRALREAEEILRIKPKKY